MTAVEKILAPEQEVEWVESVLKRVRSGDIDAYTEIIRAYQDDVWKVVIFALRDMDVSADLVQQAFVNAYFSLDSFEYGRPFGPWIRQIARNLLRQELRRLGRESQKYSAYHDHLQTCGESDERADDYEQELRAALSVCREKLSEPAKKAVELRYDQSLSFDKIAETLGRTLAATRQLLQRVRLQLRNCIEGQVEASS